MSTAISRRPVPMAVSSALAGAAAAGIMVTAVWLCRYGLDFTDEGFYLNSMAHPGRYPVTISQFGFVYHPLYVLLDGNIRLLRGANVLLTFGLAWVAAHALFGRYAASPDTTPRWQRLCHSAALATSSLLCFGLWLLTPSYNSLVLQGALLLIAGLAWQSGPGQMAAAFAPIAIGTGAWLAFLAKPTVVVIALVVVPVVLLSTARPMLSRIRILAIAAAVALAELLITALAIDGSIGGFTHRLDLGQQRLSILGDGQSVQDPFRWDSFNAGHLQWAATGTLALGAAGLATALVVSDRRARWAFAAAGGCLLVMTALLTPAPGSVFSVSNPYLDALLLALPIAMVTLVIPGIRHADSIPGRRATVVMVVGLLVAPHLLAFGSGVNYWRQAGMAGCLWAYASAMLLALAGGDGGRARAGIAVLGLMVPVLVARLLLPAMAAPYRQPPDVLRSVTEVRLDAWGGSLYLDPTVAAFLTNSGRALQRAGFHEGTPMLDLTGKSPTLLYAWGAVAAVQPWDIGGYPGSADVTAAALSDLPCAVVARLWLLTEPGGPRAISSSVLASEGVIFPADFERAATWTAPVALTRESQPITQVVYRPGRTAAEATNACTEAATP